MPNLFQRIKSFVNTPTFQNTIMVLIMANAVVIGLDTYPGIRAEYGTLLSSIDQFIIWIFVVEITLRWISWSPRYKFLANGWNLFDFLIISVALLPTATYFSIIRIFRVHQPSHGQASYKGQHNQTLDGVSLFLVWDEGDFVRNVN